MNHRDAERRIWQKRAVGLVVMMVCITVVLAGLLKYVYVGLEDGAAVFAEPTLAVKQVIYCIYQRTQFLSSVWRHSPMPDFGHLSSHSNLWFLGFYFGTFVGLALVRSGNRLAGRLRRIEQDIEDELIRDSLRGAPVRTREQIRSGVRIPAESMWKDIHVLYIAPLIVGALLLLLDWLIGV